MVLHLLLSHVARVLVFPPHHLRFWIQGSKRKKDIQEENSLKLVSLTKEVLQLYEKTETMQRQILKMKERQQKSLDSLGTKIKSMSYLEGNNEEILRAEAKKAEDIHEMAAYA